MEIRKLYKGGYYACSDLESIQDKQIKFSIKPKIYDATKKKPARARVTIELILPDEETKQFFIENAESLSVAFFQLMAESINQVGLVQAPRADNIYK